MGCFLGHAAVHPFIFLMKQSSKSHPKRFKGVSNHSAAKHAKLSSVPRHPVTRSNFTPWASPFSPRIT